MAEAAREHPYASFIHRVAKPSRYLGGEHGEVVKDWAAVDARVVPGVPRRLRHRACAISASRSSTRS